MRKSDKERSWMEKYAPPGIPLTQEVVYWIMILTICTFWTMQFILQYINIRGTMYEYRAGRKVLIEGAMMVPFEILTENLFHVFFLAFIYVAIIVVYHYFYHYQGSKMMYLMKRLPNKWEVHIRCWILPVAACVVTVVLMTLLKALYYAIYILFTPSQCLPL